MESNGKRVAMDGSDLTVHSGPVVWGEPGTNGQHAFYQLIHQGTRVIPCEFMVARNGHEPELAHQHRLLVANCLAQSEALLRGRSLEEARAIMAKRGLTGAELDRQARHRVFPGNRPSTTLVYDRLTPFVLGQIVALYEHRVFVEGVVLGINSYDQWGVELGKELATALGPGAGGHGECGWQGRIDPDAGRGAQGVGGHTVPPPARPCHPRESGDPDALRPRLARGNTAPAWLKLAPRDTPPRNTPQGALTSRQAILTRDYRALPVTSNIKDLTLCAHVHGAAPGTRYQGSAATTMISTL
jgi:hypothetical protein